MLIQAHELEIGDSILSPNGKRFVVTAVLEPLDQVIVNTLTEIHFGSQNEKLGWDMKRFVFSPKDMVKVEVASE
jgi:hypothetical protein